MGNVYDIATVVLGTEKKFSLWKDPYIFKKQGTKCLLLYSCSPVSTLGTHSCCLGPIQWFPSLVGPSQPYKGRQYKICIFLWKLVLMLRFLLFFFFLFFPSEGKACCLSHQCLQQGLTTLLLSALLTLLKRESAQVSNLHPTPPGLSEGTVLEAQHGPCLLQQLTA